MSAIATRVTFGETVVRLADTNRDIVVLDADLRKSTMTDEFSRKYPDRFFDVGIAEGNMVGVGAGMALALHTEAPGTRRIYPQEGLPSPTLRLVSSPVGPSARAWWRILGARPQALYFLWVSEGAGDGQMDGLPVLVDTSLLLYDPIAMPKGELTLMVPATVSDSVWVQAAEVGLDGSILAVSNGLRHSLESAGTGF